MKWTLSGICYYLIWFFAVGTTACTTTTRAAKTHMIDRVEFAKLAKSPSNSGATEAMVKDIEGTSLSANRRTKVFVVNKKGDRPWKERRVKAFSFTLNEDLVTPLPGEDSTAVKQPFTLTPKDASIPDHYEIRVGPKSKVSVLRTALLVTGILSLGFLGWLSHVVRK